MRRSQIRLTALVMGLVLLAGCASATKQGQGLWNPAQTESGFSACPIYNITANFAAGPGPTTQPAGQAVDQTSVQGGWCSANARPGAQVMVIELEGGIASTASQRAQTTGTATGGQQTASADPETGISAAIQAQGIGQQGATPAAAGAGSATSGALDQKLDQMFDFFKLYLPAMDKLIALLEAQTAVEEEPTSQPVE